MQESSVFSKYRYPTRDDTESRFSLTYVVFGLIPLEMISTSLYFFGKQPQQSDRAYGYLSKYHFYMATWTFPINLCHVWDILVPETFDGVQAIHQISCHKV